MVKNAIVIFSYTVAECTIFGVALFLLAQMHVCVEWSCNYQDF